MTTKIYKIDLTWDDIQKQSDTILSCGLYKLKTQPFCDLADVTEKGSGNYLISLDEVPFYIGEGKDLIERLKRQFRPADSNFYKNFKKTQPFRSLAYRTKYRQV
jgi:hypothetical protein